MTEGLQAGGKYPAVARAVKDQTISRLSDAHRNLLAVTPRKTDLSDPDAVEAVAEKYQQICAESGICPSFMGFSAALGWSRKHLYEYSRNFPNAPTTGIFDRLRTAWAALRIALSEAGAISEASAIFVLKNSGHGLTDKSEVVIEPREITPLSDLEDAEAAQRRILEAIPLDDDEDS